MQTALGLRMEHLEIILSINEAEQDAVSQHVPVAFPFIRFEARGYSHYSL